MKKITLAAGILAASSLTFGTSAAHATVCPTGAPQLGTLIPLTYTCTQGNFKFDLTGWTGFLSTDTISFANSGDSSFTYSINSDTPWLSGTTRSLSYVVTAPSGKVLTAYTSALSSSQANPKSGQFDVAGAAGTAMGTLINASATNDQHDYVPANLTFDGYTATLTVPYSGQPAGNGIQTVQSTVFTGNPPSGVPGPLPILGAGAAFGFSRKLRSRIKLVA